MPLPRAFIASASTCLSVYFQRRDAQTHRRKANKTRAHFFFASLRLCVSALSFAVLLTSCVLDAGRKPRMERVVLSRDGKSFMFAESKKPFRPWGVNYGNNGRLMEDFWNEDWQ